MLEILSHPAFRGKQEVETGTQTVRRVHEALRCKRNIAEEPFASVQLPKWFGPPNDAQPWKVIPNQSRNDPRFPCYRPRNDPQWILGIATKGGTVDRSMTIIIMLTDKKSNKRETSIRNRISQQEHLENSLSICSTLWDHYAYFLGNFKVSGHTSKPFKCKSTDTYTVEPRYNEVSRYRKKCSLYRGLRYSEDPVITNYLVNSKKIRYSGVTKLNQAEQWDIHHAKQSTDLHINSNI